MRLCSSRRYKNAARSRQLCERAASFLVPRLRAGPAQWVALGVGQGEKEMLFLRPLAPRQRIEYVPWDTSQTLLEMAGRRALGCGLSVWAMKADLEQESHWKAVPAAPRGSRRVLSVFGNSLGAVRLDRLLTRASQLLHRGDWFLVDGELHAGEATLAGYDHPVNRAFAFAPLEAAGFSRADGELRFTLRAPSGGSPLGRLEKQFDLKRPVALRLGGEMLRFRRGDRIRMSPSDKCHLEAMTARLGQDRLFQVEERLLSSDRRFALWILRRSGR